LSLFCDGRAANFQKSPRDWGRLEYAIFSTDIVTRHVYCPCVEFNAFFLRNCSMKCQIGCLIIILTSSILILQSTSRHLARWQSRSWLKKILVRWDLIFRDCQWNSTLRPRIEIETSNTTHVCVRSGLNLK